jgi:hypothetical protein
MHPDITETPMQRLPAIFGVLALVALPVEVFSQSPGGVDEAFFEKKVRPVLAEQCYSCHGPAKQRGGLRLDSRAALLEGGESGPAIVVGKAEESLLIKAIRQQGELKMPPRQLLSKQKISDLATWITHGAPWPGGDKAVAVKRQETEVTDKDREHWSFRPLKRPAVPEVGTTNPIDAFIVAGLKAKGLTLSEPASARALIRRVTFDLMGLPPSPEAVERFVRDPSDVAYEKLVDDLLRSPQYGERWGRHWLDVVRFAQSSGYERDAEKPNAWRYRDYVIDAFNADKPYDQFVREQIAGDEIAPVTDAGRTATAFFHLGVWDDEPDDQKQADMDQLDDMVSTLGEAFLGLSIGCARCHDHKFDPIPQDDYYSMVAFLRNIKPGRKAEKGVDPSQIALEKGGQTLGVNEDGPNAPPTFVLAAGQVARKGKQVEPRYLRVLCESKDVAEPRSFPKAEKSTGRRTRLAEWITAKDNPLTARVIVNRLWHWHFGRGLVATPSDLGRNGAVPTHPELLDWLASDLIDGGWTLKRMHRQIVHSRTYRQSSAVRADSASVDPGNLLLWRQNLRRLEAEAIRDAVLATSGTLNLKAGGPGIFPTLPREVLETQSRPGDGWKPSPHEEQNRRSVYIFVKRTLGVPLLETFDFPSSEKSAAARNTTTIAPQALILLNSEFMDKQAAAFAQRIRSLGTGDVSRDVDQAFRFALQRAPTDEERRIAIAYLDRVAATSSGDAALSGLCRLVLNLNEFVYVD